MKYFTCLFSVILLALALTGCMVGPDYHTPATTMPVSFVPPPPSTEPVTIDITQWWKSLNDPHLNDLIDQAVANNLDLGIALARLQQARESEFAVSGMGFPDIEAAGGAARGSGTNSTKGRVPGPLNAATNSDGLSEITEVAGFDSVWEIDLFGGLRRELEAARYDRQAAAEARRDVLVTLVSDVARAYIDDRAMQLQLAIVQNEIDSAGRSNDLAQARFKRGFTNELDPQIAKRELDSIEAEVSPLRAAIQRDERRIAVLTGQPPSALPAPIDRAAALPQIPTRIEPGIPVDLLRRRPDIRQAERQLAASTARIGVAADALYPHVALTAGLGMQGQGLGRTPVENKFIGSIGPEAYWPLLDFGTLDALVQRQDYHTQEMLLNYQKTILTAVEEVDNAIANFSAQQDRLDKLNDALTAARRAMEIANQRYQQGFTNYLDVLDAERELYTLEDEQATTQEDVVIQFIAVYKSLGGGWETFDKVPDARQPRPAVMASFQPVSNSEHR
jgi:NodT family efflux transporter outer membrane factor (OMF) lipoprotein